MKLCKTHICMHTERYMHTCVYMHIIYALLPLGFMQNFVLVTYVFLFSIDCCIHKGFLKCIFYRQRTYSHGISILPGKHANQ